MIPFTAKRDGIHLQLSPAERELVGNLLDQVVELLGTDDRDDPALARLFPDAYSDDPEAASEFRRLTSDDITEAKIANARTAQSSLTTDRKTPLTQDAQQAWLRTLTDLRLTLGARLGVDADGFAPSADHQVLAMRDLFDWLGYVQESLVVALTR